MVKRMLRQRSLRANDGYALVAVITITAFGGMLLLTLTSMLLQVATSERLHFAKAKSQRTVESAVSYVVGQFQKLDDNNLLPDDANPYSEYTLPSDAFPDATVRVRVRRLTTADLSTLRDNDKEFLLYDPQWDPGGAGAPNQVRPAKVYFFVVDLTAYDGAFASSARITLAPADPTVTPPVVPLTRPTGLISDGPITLGSNNGYLDVLAPGDGFTSDQTVTEGGQASFKTSVQSNTSVSTSPSTTVYGDLIVNNSDSSGTLAQSNGSLVFGRLQTNVTSSATPTDGFQWTNNSSTPNFGSDNVWALADGFASNFSDINRVGLNYSQAGGMTNTANLPIQSYPVPTPVNTSPLPTSSADGTASNVSIASGSYNTSSSSLLNATNTITVDSDGITKVYIDPAPPSDLTQPTDVRIDSSLFSNNGGAENLQIIYSGNQPLNIQLSGDLGGAKEMNATIYAPNSVVSTSGYGEFYGAILAKSANINHVGDFRIDQAAASNLAGLTNMSGRSQGGGESKILSSQITPSKYVIKTWQTVKGSIVSRG